ncbi:hypothetical protein B0H12DRAFT_1109213 [Mycena haematopus]|nr:hypothetical protein B0H12DRAFT_1109213 [Mycena haematopus]
MLPQELVDKILDCLYDDKPSLGQCSLVCWAWVPATRFHIFADITLRRRWIRMMHPQFREFLDLLAADTCTLAPFVVRLTLEDLDPTPEAGRECTAFSALCRLTSVASLTFDNWQNLGVQPVHKLLPSLTALSELALIEVTVNSASQLFSMLEMCPSLTSLTIVSVSWKPSSSPVSYSHARSIRTLNLGSCPIDEFLDIFAPPNASFQLTCNTVEIRKIEPEDAPSICRFLNSIAESLQHLTIGFTDYYEVDRSPALEAEKLLCTCLDLQKHTRLTSFHVDVALIDTERSLTMLYALRCALYSPNLEELGFSLAGALSEEHLRTQLRWDEIDDILSSRSSQLDSLRRLKFRTVNYNEWLQQDYESDIFPTLLPQCCARNIDILTTF